MKKIALIIFAVIGAHLNAQTIDYNTKKGYAAEGYDVVAYFDNTAIKGDTKFSSAYDNVKYKFSSQKNLERFESSPEKYVPKYGGYCAYAIATKAKKVSIDPKTFEIRDGALYLFYNAWGTNTLDLWLNEAPNELRLKADDNWMLIKEK